MINLETKLIEIFCHVDDFNEVFIRELRTHQLSDGSRKRIKPSIISESEVMTIIIYFHLMSYRNFKHYYLFHVCRNMTSEFPNLVSYNRFVELSNKSLLPLVAYLRTQCLGKCTGISFIDSTPLRACHIKREHSHKVLQGLADKGHNVVSAGSIDSSFISLSMIRARSWILFLPLETSMTESL